MGASGFESWPEDYPFLWLTSMIILTHSMQMLECYLKTDHWCFLLALLN